MPTFLAEEQKFVPWIAEMIRNTCISVMNFSLKIVHVFNTVLKLMPYTQKVTQAVSRVCK